MLTINNAIYTIYEKFFNGEWKFSQTITQRIKARITGNYEFNITGNMFPPIPYYMKQGISTICDSDKYWQSIVIFSKNTEPKYKWSIKYKTFLKNLCKGCIINVTRRIHVGR